MEGTTKLTSAQSRKARVRLTPQQRSDLLSITRSGSTRTKRFLHARVLLLADEAQAGGGLTDQQISQSLGIAVKTISRIRHAFLKGGITVAVERKKRATPPIEPVIDGKAEAMLVAVCCSPAPSGRARWSLQLLADELVKRKIVVGVCKETVRKTLKKTGCSLGV
jgi:hypothetical protein